jgi:hypothetical protein
MLKYCSATVESSHLENTPDGDVVETTTTSIEFDCFEDVVAHLKFVREQNLNQIADAITNGQADRKDFVNTGGFTCDLHNRFGGVVEFALGTDYALMMRKEPKPFTWYKNGPNSEEILAFYISGGHHTEFSLNELATRADALKKLENWINTGEFPQ